MNTILCLTVLLACTAMALAETCGGTNDCSHITCPENDYMLNCVSGQCTCTHTTSGCSSASDCDNLPHCHHSGHCVDQRCHCGSFPGNGGQQGMPFHRPLAYRAYHDYYDRIHNRYHDLYHHPHQQSYQHPYHHPFFNTYHSPYHHFQDGHLYGQRWYDHPPSMYGRDYTHRFPPITGFPRTKFKSASEYGNPYTSYTGPYGLTEPRYDMLLNDELNLLPKYSKYNKYPLKMYY